MESRSDLLLLVSQSDPTQFDSLWGLGVLIIRSVPILMSLLCQTDSQPSALLVFGVLAHDDPSRYQGHVNSVISLIESLISK